MFKGLIFPADILAYAANIICNPVYIIYHIDLILIALLGSAVFLIVISLLDHCFSLMLYL